MPSAFSLYGVKEEKASIHGECIDFLQKIWQNINIKLSAKMEQEARGLGCKRDKSYGHYARTSI